MAHPLRAETNASQQAKLRSMTAQYGDASPKMKKLAPVDMDKMEGPEDDVGYGADSSAPRARSDRRARKSVSANPLSTYKRGGRVKHRDSGGDVMDSGDIEGADINQKLASHRRGGKVKHRATGGITSIPSSSSTTNPTSTAASTTIPSSSTASTSTLPSAAQQYLADIGQKRGGGVKARHRAHGGRVRGEMSGSMEPPMKVKMGGKYATQSSEPSPTPVDNRARGGRTGGHGRKKGGNHVNIMIAPQGGHQPMAPPVSAMPMPPPMPPAAKPPMSPPGMPPGGPPMGGMPPGGPMGGMMPPPGAMPPGIMPPRKRGGRVVTKKHPDEAQDMHLIKHMVKESSMKSHGSMRAAGGRLTAGAATGEGRLEKIAMQKHQNKHPQEV